MNLSTNWRWWVCGILFLATMLNYMDRMTVSLVATELKTRIQLNDVRYGNIERAFSWAFALGGISFGFLADRFGPRKLYPLVLFGWSCAGILTGFADYQFIQDWLQKADAPPGRGSYYWLLITRTMLGFFEAGHWPCALLTARAVLSASDRPLGNGVLQSGASVGAILTPFVIQGFRSAGFAWPVPFWVIGALGLLWIPLWLRVMKPAAFHTSNTPTTANTPALPPAVFYLRFSALLIVVICLNITWQFLRAWLPKFLKENKLYSEFEGNMITVGYFIAADIGCILSGFVVLWCVRRKCSLHTGRLISFAMCVMFVMCALAIPSLPKGWILLGCIFIVGAGILGLHPLYYALVQDLSLKSMGLFSGLLSAMSWFIVGFFQGRLGRHIETTGSYAIGFWIASLAPLLALFAIIGLWPREQRLLPTEKSGEE
ncbi:MAG: MFS transporter [Zavarzinella sp.]